MQAVQDIFQIWPSVRTMADSLKRPYDTVLAWRIRGRIPEDAWEDVIEAALREGKRLSATDILAANAPLGRRGRRAKALSTRTRKRAEPRADN